jgi:hypothetical protein
VRGARAFVSLQPNVLHVVDVAHGTVIGTRAYKSIPWVITP